jgi:hypothetical protein
MVYRRYPGRSSIVLVALPLLAVLVPGAARSDGNDASATLSALYAFTDHGQTVLMMTVYPFAPPTATFSTSAQYVFHTSSGDAFGKGTSQVDIICTFAGPKSVTCWLGKDDYVTGDPSDAAHPLVSLNGGFRVFAGLRADPMFFNFSGFSDTVDVVRSAEGSLTFDSAGCPALDAATSSALVSTLSETATKANPSRTNPDDFVNANVLALVVQIDPKLAPAVTQGGRFVSLWASTNRVGQ